MPVYSWNRSPEKGQNQLKHRWCNFDVFITFIVCVGACVCVCACLPVHALVNCENKLDNLANVAFGYPFTTSISLDYTYLSVIFTYCVFCGFSNYGAVSDGERSISREGQPAEHCPTPGHSLPHHVACVQVSYTTSLLSGQPMSLYKWMNECFWSLQVLWIPNNKMLLKAWKDSISCLPSHTPFPPVAFCCFC